MLTRRAALLASAALPFAAPAQRSNPRRLRIAMTVADIPVTDGAPDQGTEGIRFMGYTMYDPLVIWDLSSATEPAKLVPGLATKWYQDPADPTKWIFELRQGVKFHHGAPFTADDVIFSLDRTLERQVAGLRPARPQRADRRPLADGRPIARSTTTRSSCRPRASTR